MISMLKKLFLPGYTDRKVDAINDASRRELEDVSRVAKRHRDLLKKNGVTMNIVIATGGDRRGH